MKHEPTYKIGQMAKINNWTGLTNQIEILDIKRTFHRRLQEYVWGYKMDGETGLTMMYVPEGYLRPLSE